jgi:arylsulfatase A-like enzyme
MKASYFYVMILLLATSHMAYCQKPVPPNVVIILTDDMGYGDISCYGAKVIPTPHIDNMAKNGMRCTQYYSAAPICSPSRAGIITGMYPARWNFSTYLDNKKHNKAAEQTDYLDPKAPSIARFFKNAGYATGHFGKWHLGGGRDVTNAPGFEQYGFDDMPAPMKVRTPTRYSLPPTGSGLIKTASNAGTAPPIL